MRWLDEDNDLLDGGTVAPDERRTASSRPSNSSSRLSVSCRSRSGDELLATGESGGVGGFADFTFDGTVRFDKEKQLKINIKVTTP